MAKIISLMGIDGSGKSSLAAKLQEELMAQGKKSVIAWAGLNPVITKPFIALAKFLLIRKQDKFKNYNNHLAARRTGMRKLAFLHGILLIALLLDYLPQVFFKVTLRRWLGKDIICDRYYHDLMLYYAVTTNSSPERFVRLVRIVERIFPKPNLCYFVSVPIEIALSRKSDVPSLEYLNERKKYYEVIVDKLNIKTLDGTLTLTDNCQQILADLLNMEHSA